MLSASIHATRKKVVGTLCVILAILIAAILFFFGPKETEGSVRLLTEEDRQAYMASFGWETGTEPSEVKTIVVPPEDDTLLQRYNEIQLGQGMDLTAFSGQEAVRYTYAVKNSDDGGTRICLYVCDGVLAAADIASLEAGWQYGIAGRAESVGSDAGASDSEEVCASCEEEAGISWVEESGDSGAEETCAPSEEENRASEAEESGDMDSMESGASEAAESESETMESETSETMESGSSASWWSRLFG
ncbi:MAG TPA: DUF4830 domain-containing protein [Oscillospiraceae bacterium]|nr:DUF4830 domain-containing protein [Oscillospiraceae bacterium]HRW56566.1 DUF4830 domain-containing protein [Oscillospiraceae bacterium]